MKTKLKNPEIAKANGPDFNKKLLKKLLMEQFVEPQRFFYDSEFDYGGEIGKQALFYIGDIPTMWKKYIKEHKKEKTFAGGLCMTDENGEIKLEIQVGKGGKAMVLKAINKELLKPFSKAYFVETIDSSVELGDVEEKEDMSLEAESDSDTEENINTDEILAEIAALSEEGNSLSSKLQPIASQLGESIKDLKNTIVTDELLKNTANAVKVINANPYADYLKEVKAMILGLDADVLAKHPNIAANLNDLKKTAEDLYKIHPELQGIVKNAAKMQKVEDPAESDFPPVSEDPFENFGSFLKGFKNKSLISKYAEETKSFSQ
jgi:hypothetical protein